MDKVDVNERALIQRINRKLAPNQILKCNRRTVKELGQYFIVDKQCNGVAQRNVNITQLARSLGALEPWEQLEKRR